MAPTWATASVRIVGGSVGVWPGSRARHCSFSDTFLMPTIALVRLELGDPIDEQERIAVRQDPLDERLVEGQLVHRVSERLTVGAAAEPLRASPVPRPQSQSLQV